MKIDMKIYWSLFFFLLITLKSHANCVSYRFRPLLWSPNGESVIILRQGLGSESSGSVDLFVTSTNMELSQFKVSSTVRSDGSLNPEIVSRKECLASLKEFNINLVNHGFSNFLHESTCKDERDYLFHKTVETTAPLDMQQQKKILQQIGFTEEATVFGSNRLSYIVAQTKSSCKAQCFWVAYSSTKDTSTKKANCLPGL